MQPPVSHEAYLARQMTPRSPWTLRDNHATPCQSGSVPGTSDDTAVALDSKQSCNPLSVRKPTWDVLVGELDVDDVGPGLGGLVGDAARAVLVVVALDVRLARALNGQAHAPVTCSTQQLTDGCTSPRLIQLID